jgi:hypothetical protein
LYSKYELPPSSYTAPARIYQKSFTGKPFFDDDVANLDRFEVFTRFTPHTHIWGILDA